jgi:hypothetical protein
MEKPIAKPMVDKTLRDGDEVIVNTGNADGSIPSIDMPGRLVWLDKKRRKALVETRSGPVEVHITRLRRK